MTVEVLEFQVKVTEWSGWTPVPDKVIEAGEFEALLTTETLPVTLPVAAGVKVAFNVTGFPGLTISPADMPLALKPGPETLTLETVILELLELVNVTLRMRLLPIFTLPNARVDAFALNGPRTALTVRVAALLVTLPTELDTTTVNRAPVSEVVSAGVV